MHFEVNPSNCIFYGALVHAEERPQAQAVLLSEETQQGGMLHKGT